MRKSFLIIAMLFIAWPIFSQEKPTTSDTIATIRRNCYAYDGERINSMKQFETIFAGNANATALFKSAKTNSIIANSFAYIGGFFVGYSFGYWITSKELNGTLLAIGCGGLAAAVPFVVVANKKLRKAVETYNADITHNQRSSDLTLSLGMVGNGVGIALQF